MPRKSKKQQNRARKAKFCRKQKHALQNKAAKQRRRNKLLDAAKHWKLLLDSLEYDPNSTNAYRWNQAYEACIKKASDEVYLSKQHKVYHTPTDNRMNKNKKNQRMKRRKGSVVYMEETLEEERDEEEVQTSQDNTKIDPDYCPIDEGNDNQKGRKKKKKQIQISRGGRGGLASNFVDCNITLAYVLEIPCGKEKWLWIYDIQHSDSLTEQSFQKQYLIIYPKSYDEELGARAWRSLKQNQDLKFIALQRDAFGMDYMFKEFRTHVHFTVGDTGIQILCRLFSVQMLNDTNLPSNMIYLKKARSKSRQNTEKEEVMAQYRILVKNFFKNLLPYLLNKKESKADRIDCTLSLGLTDQRCDRYQVVNIFGTVCPDLIDLPEGLDDAVCLELGKLGLFFSRKVVPTFNLQKAYFKNKYVSLFGQQLGLSEEEAEDFCIPSFSASIPITTLRPHVDGLNPKDKDMDITVQSCVSLKVAELNEVSQARIQTRYGSIEFLQCSLLTYGRRAVERHCELENRTNAFIVKGGELEKPGRTLLVSIFNDVACHYDCVCFSKESFKQMNDRANYFHRDFKYAGKGFTIEELPDKLAWWSAPLDKFFSFAAVHGMNKTTAIEYVLFFGHQTGSTPVLGSAMDRLIQDFNAVKKLNTPNKKASLYTLLVNTCRKMKDNEVTKDVAHGIFQRYSPTNIAVFEEEKTIEESVKFIRKAIDKANSAMGQVSSKEKNVDGILKRLQIVQDFLNVLQQINSIGPVRSMHMMQLLSLIGLLDLSFYVYTPLHMSGGPAKFLVNELGKENNMNEQEVLAYNAVLLHDCRQTFNNEVRSDVLEQTFCYSSRGVLKQDCFLKGIKISAGEGSSFIEDHSKLKRVVFQKEKLQNFFRIKGEKKFQWNLQMFNGNELQIMHGVKVDAPMVEWRDERLFFNTNFHLD